MLLLLNYLIWTQFGEIFGDRGRTPTTFHQYQWRAPHYQTRYLLSILLLMQVYNFYSGIAATMRGFWFSQLTRNWIFSRVCSWSGHWSSVQHTFQRHDLDIILDYIEDNYIGAYRKGHYRAPRFEYDMWGVCDRVQNELPRTNNAVEGWHDRFNRHVGCHHANIWKLIEVLKNEEDISRIELLHIQQGWVQQNANPVYARINARVNTVVNDYANRGHLNYLRGIAYNITV